MITETETIIIRCLTDMAHVNARLSFATAQANHDLQKYGEWQWNYMELENECQAAYEAADQALDRALQEQRAPRSTKNAE